MNANQHLLKCLHSYTFMTPSGGAKYMYIIFKSWIWLNDCALIVHVDQLNPLNQWVFSVWVLPSAILLHATEVLHQSWRKGWCHRQTPGPSQVFSRARCFGPTFGTHNDYFQKKNTAAINSKLFKTTKPCRLQNKPYIYKTHQPVTLLP